MSRWRSAAALALAALVASTIARAGGDYAGVGRAATPAEVAAWDIDVRPDFKGLPPGSGSVAQGQKVWESKCESCHGTFGESNEVFTPIVGGTTAEDIRTGHVKSLLNPEVQRTTLMKLATLSTLWDYIRRAMPWNAPKSLTTDEVYAVTAYILNLGDILPNDFVLSDRTMAQVQARLPNRNGLTRDHGLWDVHAKADVANVACMKDCTNEVRITSAFPEQAKGSHGELAAQYRHFEETAPHAGSVLAESAGSVTAAAQLARSSGCFFCHGVDHPIVGPGFRAIAERYRGRPRIEATLEAKLRTGGAGTWGAAAMPPNSELADRDARELIQWVLSGAP